MRKISVSFSMTLALITMCCSANAELKMHFVEGAPKDQFQIENASLCELSGGTLRLDLASSAGALVFDVSNSGAGVEVFQPFEIVLGRDVLVNEPSVMDGQNFINFNIDTFAPGERLIFTIDVDDTLGGREITVSGAEIAGATISHLYEGSLTTTTFLADASANLAMTSC